MLIKNGFLLDYESKEFVKRDIKVIDGKIHEISDNIINDDKDIVIDATNMYITPGLIDAHSHIALVRKEWDNWEMIVVIILQH